jgi:hypothetical protein
MGRFGSGEWVQLPVTNSLQLEYLRQAAKVAAGDLACQWGKLKPVPFNFAQGCDMKNTVMNGAAMPVELAEQEVGVVAGGGIGADPPWPKLTAAAGMLPIGEEPQWPKLNGLVGAATVGADPTWPK